MSSYVLNPSLPNMRRMLIWYLVAALGANIGVLLRYIHSPYGWQTLSMEIANLLFLLFVFLTAWKDQEPKSLRLGCYAMVLSMVSDISFLLIHIQR